jgi:hypothetical protein
MSEACSLEANKDVAFQALARAGLFGPGGRANQKSVA